MTMPSEPVSIAVAVVQHAGNVLIGRRAPEGPLGGFWEFPGGRVRPDETPREAAARECREETGLAVRIGQLRLETVHHYDHGRLRLQFFDASALDPAQTPREPFRWVAVSELGDYSFPAANAAVLELLLAGNPRRDGETEMRRTS